MKHSKKLLVSVAAASFAMSSNVWAVDTVVTDPSPEIELRDDTVQGAGTETDWGICVDNSGTCPTGTEPPDEHLHIGNDNDGNFGSSIAIQIQPGAGGLSTPLMYLTNTNRIGINTTTPDEAIHIVDPSPGLQLTDSDAGAGLFEMELNTFALLMEGTGGTDIVTLDVRSPVDRMYIDDVGNIAFGHDAPDVIMHVKDEDPQFKMEATNVVPAEKELIKLINNGGVNFKLDDMSGGVGVNGEWTFRTGQVGGVPGQKFVIGKSGTPVQEFQVFSGGNASLAGTLSQGSSRARKENIVGVDPAEVLAKVIELPVSEWSYIHDKGKVRHVGPMAEDFHQQFKLGTGPKTLSSIDTGGVALAAIKGLHGELEKRDARIAELEAQLGQQQQQIAALDRRQDRLAELERVVATLVNQNDDSYQTAELTQQ